MANPLGFVTVPSNLNLWLNATKAWCYLDTSEVMKYLWLTATSQDWNRKLGPWHWMHFKMAIWTSVEPSYLNSGSKLILSMNQTLHRCGNRFKVHLPPTWFQYPLGKAESREMKSTEGRDKAWKISNSYFYSFFGKPLKTPKSSRRSVVWVCLNL